MADPTKIMFHQAGDGVSSHVSVSIGQDMATVEQRNRLVAVLNSPSVIAAVNRALEQALDQEFIHNCDA